MNQSNSFAPSPISLRHSPKNFGSDLASESPAMRAFGTFRRMIFAVRTLKSASRSGVLAALLSGSFHIAQSRTRVAKWPDSRSIQRSHAARPSSPVGMPMDRLGPPPPL